MKIKKRYVTVVAGIGLLGVLLWWAGIRETLTLLFSADLNYLGIAFLMYCLSVLVWAVRWRIFLEKANIKVPFIRILGGIFVGIFVNNLTPGARTGGEPVKAFYITRGMGKNESYPRVLATVMADRILDVIPVMAFMVVALLYALKLRENILVAVLAFSSLLIMLILAITLIFSLKERYALVIIMKIVGIFKRIFPKKLGDGEIVEAKVRSAIREFKETLLGIANKRKDVIIPLLWSFLLWSLDILRTYFVFLSIGWRVSLVKVLLVKMASMAMAMISIVPGGIGVSEVVQSALFLVVGIEKSVAVSAILLDRLISFWFPTLIGGILLIKERV
ncbi:lysylphosphatidylglycerol synthetase family protein [Pyrococcus furiosus DSM 3638]|uniref:TIGR00374 family protein n=3 Tax=Pyrococcus furiosus TaxID=2261 RepID=Q8U4B8_PYRFU|nr:lysylphosphatidylglycerol synthase transmembrane domain-containing protein [Pyrococcus furiosus]AAL80294.1 hypothetical protein PF0170 [Pyrococcus furiosus DSM 3638]AFN04406.1 hypothetical protein PFC_07350 [Pyrococcus furiosus COM1]QEK77897.1 lysylphosphatidylglycerol synthetase family protein [Pyrococcus furiosus DSM 3638]